jgi:hypothetical protein
MRMIELVSMAVEMPEVKGHPNRAAFRGVLTLVDVVSQRAPEGSKGRRVVLTRSAAEAALPSLLGMALDYAPTYDRHDQRRKVGVITSAEIVGRDLEVGGYLFAKDFPDVVGEIAKSGRRIAASDERIPALAQNIREAASELLVSKTPLASAATSRGPIDVNGVQFPLTKTTRHVARGRWSDGGRMRAELTAAVERLRDLTASVSGRRIPSLRAVSDVAAGAGAGLGMSFEVTNAILADTRARVWTLTKVTFTGAAILRRNCAAYQNTWIELV